MNTPDTNKNTQTVDIYVTNINTPDTEWDAKAEFIKEYCVKRPAQDIRWIRSIFYDEKDKIEKILEFIDKTVSSRDTYWKERVEMAVVEERLKHCCCVIEDSQVTESCKLHSALIAKAYDAGYQQRMIDHELDLPFTRTREFRDAVDKIGTLDTPTPITNEDNLK